MGLLHPGYFILSLFIITVIIFYMFRKRYENKIIPSNLLWEQVMNEWQASPWLHKLQKNILLLLQILILVLLMLSLVQPYWLKKGLPPGNIIIVIDDSASMSAVHKDSTRFEKAKEEVLTLIKQIDNQEVSIILARSSPKLLLNKESNKKKIRQTISELELSYEYSDMKKAMRLAESLAVNDDTSLFVFSDSVLEEELWQLPELLPVTVMNIGEEGENVSLKSFGVGFENDTIAGIAVIENQTQRIMDAQLQVKAEENLLFEQNITLQQGEQVFVHIPNLPEHDYYQAQIETSDDYQVDNRIIAVYRKTLSKIYAIGDVSPFIIKGLENIGFEVLQLENTASSNDLLDGIVVVDGIPVEEWPNRPILAIAPNKSNAVNLEEEIAISHDPIFRYVEFQNVYVKSAFLNKSMPIQTIAESGGVPIIQKGQINGIPTIALHFSMEASDWPLHVGFPIFLFHSVQWLSSQATFFGFFQPGEERWINATAENDEWKVFNENGEFIDNYHLRQESFVAPQSPGLYQIVNGNEATYFAVNLDEREKKISTFPSFSLNQPEKENDVQADIQPYSNLWYWLTLAGLIILVIEWEVMRRGSRI